MSPSLLTSDNAGVEARSGSSLHGRLDCLLADCLDCGLDDVPHSAGREGECLGAAQESSVHHRRSRLARRFPTEHLDA